MFVGPYFSISQYGIIKEHKFNCTNGTSSLKLWKAINISIYYKNIQIGLNMNCMNPVQEKKSNKFKYILKLMFCDTYKGYCIDEVTFCVKKWHFVSKSDILCQKVTFCVKKWHFVSKSDISCKKVTFCVKKWNFVAKKWHFGSNVTFSVVLSFCSW